MNAYIVERSIEMGVLILLGLCFISIMVVAIYDIIRSSTRQHLPRVLQHQPHITVLVYTKNNAQTIRANLKSIMQSTYRHFDVVMVDDGSVDDTYQVAKGLQQNMKRGRLVIFKKRKPALRSEVLYAAYRKSLKGDLVLVLNADTTITKQLLRQCAGEYRAFPAEAIKLNRQYEVADNLRAVLPRFQQLGHHLQMKLFSFLKNRNNYTDEGEVVYTRTTFLALRKTRVPVSYRGHLIVKTLTVPTFLSVPRLSAVSVLGIICGLALLSYAGFEAVVNHTPTLLLLSWLVVCLWFLGALWLDEAEKTEGKIKLTFTLPPLYFFIYLTGILQLIMLPIKRFFNRG